VLYEQCLTDQLENVILNHYNYFDKTTYGTICFCYMVEKGRHFNIDRENLDCIYYESMLEDEYHFLIVCSIYVSYVLYM
jgi:hypothetical protein